MYRTAAQIESAISILSSWFPQYFTRIPLPNRSVQGRDIAALRMRAGGGGERRGVLLVGGTHARELMNPDAIVDLALDLLLAHANGTDVVYGGKRWTNEDIELILESLDLYLLPCLNPDGREHVMTVDDMWRKNLRDNPETVCDGVDLNRNADFLWGVTQGQTSCSPCSEVFSGSAPFSEPETQNLKWLLDERRITCFADVHSFSELVLHPWGHAPTQTTDPTRRFTTLPTGTCAPIAVPGHAEYMPPRDLQRFSTVGARIVDAIRAVRGRVYKSQASIALYPTTGTQSDYAYARHIASPGLRKIYGYTFETGPNTGDARESFHPADPTLVKRDAKSGMLALAQQCVCAIELIGLQLLARDTEIAQLRRIRDDLLASTEGGRRWIALFERLGPQLVGGVLSDERARGEAADVLQRAGRAIEAEWVSEEDAAAAQRLVRRLAEHAGRPDDAEDLRQAADALGRMAGRSTTEALETLMRSS